MHHTTATYFHGMAGGSPVQLAAPVTIVAILAVILAALAVIRWRLAASR